jgi:hypothetical protein
VNLPEFLGFGSGLVINRLAEKIENPAERAVADRHFDCGTCVRRFHAAHKPVRAAHSNAAHGIVADVLRDLGD